MGIIWSKPEESGTIDGPPFRTPFSDALSTIGHWDGTPCEKFELQLLDCFQAVGPIRGTERCKLYFQDFKECTHNWKQNHRVIEMRKERHRQWIKGKLGRGPETEWNLPANPQDSYGPDPWYDS